VRPWVRALRVVLATGDVLHVERGAVTAQDGRFVVATSEGERHLVVPPLRVPDVPKCSAGYFAAPDMDLVDLFIGSEGTLGVIVEAELLTRARPAGVCWILTSLRSERAAIALTGDLREDAVIDVAAIEHIDARAIDVLREDSVDRRLGITMPAEASVLLLAQIEIDDAAAADGLDERLLDQLARLLDKYGALDTAEIVLPGNARRQAALVELRESVPAGVNRRVAIAHGADARISKTAADMIVPFGAFAPLMEHCRDLARAQDLDVAIWGHISDGNVHPNVIPRSYADVERGRAWILALADRVVSLGGSPLAEHGVGRNPVKQRLLRKLYGSAGVDAMRRLKLDLDPAAKFGAGVLFEMTGVHHAG
jgi:D-lactate dehydrogenase (cytochrome)